MHDKLLTGHRDQHMASFIPFPPTARDMHTSDLDAVISLQSTCYAHQFREPKQAFAAKLNAVPASAWVVDGPSGLWAYLVCLPIEGDQLPALHATEWHTPPSPQWLYLHDLAIHPDARGAGLAGVLLSKAHELAFSQGWQALGLIAVQDSHAFWRKQGFEPAELPSPLIHADKLASFGKEATFMLRRIKVD